MRWLAVSKLDAGCELPHRPSNVVAVRSRCRRPEEGAMKRTMARMLVGGVLLAGLFGLLSGGSAQASYVCNTVSGITECHDVTFTHGAFVEVIKGSNGAVAAVAYYGTTGAAVVKGYKTTGAVI